MTNQESKQLTREYIRTALLQLMKNTPFQKITVTSIIERAGISRAGFYRNYDSKEDVLAEIIHLFTEKITSYFLDELGPKDNYERYVTLFTDLKKHKNEILIMMEQKNSQKYSFDTKFFLEQFYNQYTPMEQYYGVALWHGIRAITYRWIENGMKESPEEMSMLMNDIYKFKPFIYKTESPF